MTDVADRIRKVIVAHLCCRADFDWQDDLADDLGADSLDPIELSIALEDEFAIAIDDVAIEDWRTADDIRQCVQARLAQ